MASPVPEMAPRHWVYLDEQRTHRHAQSAQTGAQGILVTTEFPMEAASPRRWCRRRRASAASLSSWRSWASWSSALPSRAAISARKRRRSSGRPLRRHFRLSTCARTRRSFLAWRPRAARCASITSTATRRGATGSSSMPRPGMDGRHVLAEMIFEFPRVDAGELTVLHARLAPPMLASAVAKEHVEAPRMGFAKLLSRAITSERMARAGSRRPR